MRADDAAAIVAEGKNDARAPVKARMVSNIMRRACRDPTRATRGALQHPRMS